MNLNKEIYRNRIFGSDKGKEIERDAGREREREREREERDRMRESAAERQETLT